MNTKDVFLLKTPKKITLDISHPELTKEWNCNKNGDLTPQNVTAGSSRKVWWVCDKGHEWEASIDPRASRGQGCPYCSGRYAIPGETDLATTHPDLAKEWHPSKNGDLTPQDVKAGSHKQVWWQCSEGHEWQAAVYSRAGGGYGCPYCAGQKAILGETDLATTHPDLAKEWHPTKNGDLKPQDVMAGSGKKVWWLSKDGHEWKAAIYSRAGGKNGCSHAYPRTSFPEQAVHFYVKKVFPDAINRCNDPGFELDVLIPSENTAIEYDGVYWHENKLNEDSRKDQKCIDSGIRLIRIREKGLEKTSKAINIFREDQTDASLCKAILELFIVLGIQDVDIQLDNDRAAIYSACEEAEKEASLALLYPEIAKEWHPTKNGKLTPQNVTASSGKRVWWQCEKGHEWQARIADRTSEQKTGCPYCSGKKAIVGETDLATTHPDLAKEWHPTKNGSLSPRDVTASSNKIVWWQCNKGHEWQAVIGSRALRKTGCPYCSGRKAVTGDNDLATTRPDLAKEWHPSKNGTLTPKDVKAGSGLKVWWRCSKGHEWQARIVDRTTKNHGCPYCSGRIPIVGENDLATTHPNLAKEWHPTKNGNLTPRDVKSGSGKKVWWLSDDGREWQAQIVKRTKRHTS